MSGHRECRTDTYRGLFLLIFATILLASIRVDAATIMYDATVQIKFWDHIHGSQYWNFNLARVEVDYGQGGAFNILGIWSDDSVLNPWTSNEHIVLWQTSDEVNPGTISGNVATGIRKWYLVGDHGNWCRNSGGTYSCTTITGGTFKAGDVYALQAWNVGSWGSYGSGREWNHYASETRIVFGVPEPSAIVILAWGGLSLYGWRRR